jgi:hypothetical protein
MGVASLILGIIALVLCWIPALGFILALIALIVAIAAMCSKKNKEKDRGLKIAGLVMSIVSIVTSVIMTVPLIIGAIIVAENSDKIKDLITQTVGESDILAVNSKLIAAYADLRADNPFLNEIDLNGAFIVDGTTYYGLEDYYTKVVPEVDKDSSKYMIPQGYKLVFEANGSARIEKK